jgi:hypothetical protein
LHLSKIVLSFVAEYTIAEVEYRKSRYTFFDHRVFPLAICSTQIAAGYPFLSKSMGERKKSENLDVTIQSTYVIVAELCKAFSQQTMSQAYIEDLTTELNRRRTIQGGFRRQERPFVYAFLKLRDEMDRYIHNEQCARDEAQLKMMLKQSKQRRRK